MFGWEYEAVREAKNFEELDRIASNTLIGTRFQNVTYILADPKDSALNPKHYFTTYSGEWEARYANERYFTCDPVILTALNSVLPFHWAELPAEERRHFVFREASDYGIDNGTTIPLPSPVGAMGMLSVTRTPNAPKPCHEETAALLLMSVNIHSRARELVSELADMPALTPRERAVIYWISRGKSSKEIAQELNISHRTVETHIYNAVNKLQVCNRTELVTKALDFGYITRNYCPK